LGRVIDVAVWAGSRVPARPAHALAVLGGHLEWALRPAKRRRLSANLVHAVGATASRRRIGALVRREVVNEARRSADLLWALGRRDEFLATVELDGIEHARRVADSGRGLLLLGLHVGGWEVATAVPADALSVPTCVVVADDWLAWAIEHARAAAGLQVLYAERSALAAARRLRRGEALLVLGDDPTHATVTRRVPFLDAYADLPVGPVRLARLTGSPIVTFAVLPLGRRRWRVVVDPPLEPPAPADRAAEDGVMRSITHRWGEVIRAHPEQWAASFRLAWHEGPA
jgi:KDO2-lipid IV(A) lauroyltransferase